MQKHICCFRQMWHWCTFEGGIAFSLGAGSQKRLHKGRSIWTRVQRVRMDFTIWKGTAQCKFRPTPVMEGQGKHHVWIQVFQPGAGPGGNCWEQYSWAPVGSRKPLKVFVWAMRLRTGEDREPSSDLEGLSAEPALAASRCRGPALVNMVRCAVIWNSVSCRGQTEQFLAADCGWEEADFRFWEVLAHGFRGWWVTTPLVELEIGVESLWRVFREDASLTTWCFDQSAL